MRNQLSSSQPLLNPVDSARRPVVVCCLAAARLTRDSASDLSAPLNATFTGSHGPQPGLHTVGWIAAIPPGRARACGSAYNALTAAYFQLTISARVLRQLATSSLSGLWMPRQPTGHARLARHSSSRNPALCADKHGRYHRSPAWRTERWGANLLATSANARGVPAISNPQPTKATAPWRHWLSGAIATNLLAAVAAAYGTLLISFLSPGLGGDLRGAIGVSVALALYVGSRWAFATAASYSPMVRGLLRGRVGTLVAAVLLIAFGVLVGRLWAQAPSPVAAAATPALSATIGGPASSRVSLPADQANVAPTLQTAPDLSSSTGTVDRQSTEPTAAADRLSPATRTDVVNTSTPAVTAIAPAAATSNPTQAEYAAQPTLASSTTYVATPTVGPGHTLLLPQYDIPHDDVTTATWAGCSVRDFRVSARFRNPVAPHPWDYGFIFRYTDDLGGYRVDVDEDKKYHVWYVNLRGGWRREAPIADGDVPNLGISGNGFNEIYVETNDHRLLLVVNSRAILDSRDLLDRVNDGDLASGAGLDRPRKEPAAITTVSDFMVRWDQDPGTPVVQANLPDAQQ
jgi:hypothetical protein